MNNELKSMSLFSDETLDSIAMAEVMGGNTINNCNGGYCAAGCGSSGPTPQPVYYFICSPIPINAYGCFYIAAGCSSTPVLDTNSDSDISRQLVAGGTPRVIQLK